MWDVDDPFDQLHAAMDNVDVIDNDRAGPDNRGTAGGPGSYTGVTDETGQARLTIEVSMQPGDNFRAAASLVELAMTEQVAQSDADALSVAEPVAGTFVENGDFTGYAAPVHLEPHADCVAQTSGSNAIQCAPPRFRRSA